MIINIGNQVRIHCTRCLTDSNSTTDVVWMVLEILKKPDHYALILHSTTHGMYKAAWDSCVTLVEQEMIINGNELMLKDV